jgi:serine protease Do
MVKRIITGVISVILVIFTLTMGACSLGTTPSETQGPASETQQSVLTSITEVVAKVEPSVVAINIEAVTYDIFNQPTQMKGAGSGWIIDKDGYIVTNNHVVEGADSVTVTLSDGSKYTAEDIKTDPLTDLAVVKIDAHNLSALDTGDSSLLEIGDGVVAVGNALGMGISATSGIVSALNVSLSESPDQTVYGLIQTDAAINPGNSGGPLVNMAGEVIGINSIKIAEVGVEGMGYAISISEAAPIIRQLIDVGYVVRPWLGIGAITVDNMVASWYNLAVDKGVLIANVVADSPAEAAGLKEGDIITTIDGKEIDNASDLVQLINSYEIGQKIEITFWRGQATNSTSLTLGESPPPQS